MSGFEWSASDDAFAPALGPLERAGQERIGRYEVRERVGAGGMGAVYRCWDPEAQREVALKVLLAGAKASEPQRRRFRREAEALGRLRHPNLLQVHAGGEQGQTPFLVTEWLEGETLALRLERERWLPLREALELTRDLASAIAYAHGQGVLHRDIKPSNVLLHRTRGPVLIDFGLAKGTGDFSHSRLTVTGSFAGTPGYAAPEQINDASAADERADVFSLGATLYALLTGRPPAHGSQTMAELLARLARRGYPPPSKLRRGLPRAVDALVLEALAPQPDERIPHARALGRRLSAALEESGDERRVPPALPALGLVLLAFGAGAWLARPGSAPGPAGTPAARRSPGGAVVAPAGSAAPTGAPSEGSARGEVDRLAAEAGEAWGEVIALPKQEGPGRVRGPADARARARRLRRAHQRAVGALRAALQAAEGAGEGEGADDLRWTLGSALNAAGRYDEALEVLEAIGRGPFLARARLTSAASYEARAGGPADFAAARRALERARAAGARSEDPEERVAGDVAALSLQALETPAEPGALVPQIRRVHEAVTREGIPFPWLATEAWFALLRLRFPLEPEALPELYSEIAKVELEASLPFWSHAWAQRWLSGWGGGIVEGRAIPARLEALATDRPERIASLLATASARYGLLGTVERLAELPQVLPNVHFTTQLRKARRVSEASAGPIVAELGEGYQVLTLPAGARAAHVLVRVPADALAWELRVRGSQVGLDLVLRPDGPPGVSVPEQRSSQTLARDEALASPSPVTRGLHQLLVMPEPWPEPSALALELRVAREGERLAPQRDPWGLRAELDPRASAEVQRALPFLSSGQEGRALQILEQLERSPWGARVFLVRARFLDIAGRWSELRSLEIPAEAGPLDRAAVAWSRAEAARHVEPESLEEELGALLSLDAELRVAHEELAVARLRRGAHAEVRRSLQALLGVDGGAPTLRALRAVARLLSGEPGGERPPVGILEDLADHPRARRLMVRALSRSRPELALGLLQGVRAELRVVPDALLEVETLLALGRGREASELLSQLRRRSLAPVSRRRLEALAARAGE